MRNIHVVLPPRRMQLKLKINHRRFHSRKVVAGASQGLIWQRGVSQGVMAQQMYERLGEMQLPRGEFARKRTVAGIPCGAELSQCGRIPVPPLWGNPIRTGTNADIPLQRHMDSHFPYGHLPQANSGLLGGSACARFRWRISVLAYRGFLLEKQCTEQRASISVAAMSMFPFIITPDVAVWCYRQSWIREL